MPGWAEMKIEVKYKGEDASYLRSIIEDVWNSLPAAARDAIGGGCNTVVLHGVQQRGPGYCNDKNRTNTGNGKHETETRSVRRG